MTPLKLLLIEDSEDDAALVTRALTRAGYEVVARRVETADALRNALAGGVWDLAIADYTMPGFSGMKALHMIREHGLDLPFIFVSGTIGEDIAVQAMRDGASDYLMKGQLARLAPAVAREMREASVRRERNRATERLAYLAYHDALTDLPNRALLHERLQQAILTSRRDSKPLALLILDLDGFKEINDALGHHAGDVVLQQVASRLRGMLREADTVARLGGDEFAMLLPLTDLDGAVLAARKILHELEQPFIVDDRPLVVHGSVGVAGFPSHARHSHELLQKADIAMYLAKADGSGYTVYSADRDKHTEQRLALTNAMRHGIEKDQFVLDYQPIISLRSGRPIGVEALLRWNHPDQGRLMPDDFIGLAEQTGLITPLTTFAVERALTDFRPPLGQRPPLRPDGTPARSLSIAVNVSPRTLHDTSFPARMASMLAAHGAAPGTVTLEITENLIMSDPDRARLCLTELHELGVCLTVDDFGTGYSSLSYLRRLPVDGLKIDKSFVIGLANGEDDALVRSIIDLAHNLRLSVVAEGVETEAVRDRLIAMGCDAAQGHFLSHPAPAADTKRWLAQQVAF